MWPHLNFAYLKAIKEVSSDLFHKITSFQGFQNSAVLIISKESVEIPHLFDKNPSMMTDDETWHGIQIEADLPLEILDRIRHILEHDQFVSFVISRSIPDDKCDFLHESYAKFIAVVLGSTPKLTFVSSRTI